MSCSGCRVLRKRCSDECMLRHCLQGIQDPQAQAHATLFVAKFFGRASLMSFASAVPPSQRPRNWHLCQLALETVLRGGSLSPLPPDFSIVGGCGRGRSVPAEDGSFWSAINSCTNQREVKGERSSMMLKRKVMNGSNIDRLENSQARDRMLPERDKKHRDATPSTEDFEKTTFGSAQRRLLRLFY